MMRNKVQARREGKQRARVAEREMGQA